MKKIALLTLGFLMVCNCAFATLPDLPEGFVGSTTIQDFGVLDSDLFYNIERSNVTSGGDAFFDVYKFKITEDSDFEMWSNSARFKINRKTAALDLDFYLYDEVKTVLGFSSSDILEFTGLNIGTYFIGITGLAPKDSIYSYSADFSVVPSSVPVPAAALFLGAGLLGIVGVRRRQLV